MVRKKAGSQPPIADRKLTKYVNYRCDVNYIGKLTTQYIPNSTVNYEGATGFKV